MSGTLESVSAYVAFTGFAIVLPGVVAQRLLGLRVDVALVAPLGLIACAALHWLSLVARAAWVHPAGLALLLLAWAARAVQARRRGAASRGHGLATGPRLLGALPPALGVMAFLAVASYPFNRLTADGAFALNPVERIDTAFQAGVAWELAADYPPQVPGLSGHELAYHLGQHLVRAAAVRWAGVSPYDLLSRFDVTLCALALVLALRGLVWHLGGAGWAVALAGWIPLMADLSFLSGGPIREIWWTDMLSSNLQMSVTFGNSLVTALALFAGALIAWCRHEHDPAPGWLLLAALLAAAVAHFKVFLAAQLVAGLALALLMTRVRSTLALLAPALVSTLLLVTGGGGQNVELRLEPLVPIRRTAAALGYEAATLAGLLAWSAVWIVAALGVRAVGLPELLRALRSRRPAALTLAGAVLAGLGPALLLRLTFEGEGADYNEAFYFMKGSVSLLAVFAMLRLGAWATRFGPAWVVAAAAALALPATLQFAWRKSVTQAERVPPHLVQVLERLAADTRPGDVVLIPPGPRFPPLPVVLHGRRVPYTRFIPYMTQFAPRERVERRRADVREFFTTSDPRRAVEIAHGLGATHVLIFGPQRLGFDPEGVLAAVARDKNAFVYRLPRPEAEGLTAD